MTTVKKVCKPTAMFSWFKKAVKMFSAALKSQKTYLYQWKAKNNDPVLFKIILLVL